jgi:nitrile hydratase
MEGRKGREGVDRGYYARRVAALASILTAKGVISQEDLTRARGPLEGEATPAAARAVARVWKDPAFRARLLSDAPRALAELGFDIPQGEVVALENTDAVHHLLVCTLCSCYDRRLLRVLPSWYKSLDYRSRAVRDPRGVLEEFGLKPKPTTEVRVHDLAADVSYLIIPKPPPGWERLSEGELAGLVTPESLLGTGEPGVP